MEAAFRHLLVLQMIPLHPKKITVKAIVEHLAEISPELRVSRRTLERDLVNLSVYFNLHADDHKPKGWSKGAGRTLELGDVSRDLELIVALQEAKRYLPGNLPPHTASILAPLFEKASQVLGAPIIRTARVNAGGTANPIVCYSRAA